MEEYILRKISKRKDKKYYHKYYDKKDKEIKDKKYIEKLIDGIYISPAYDNVKINLKKDAKVRAIKEYKTQHDANITSGDYFSEEIIKSLAVTRGARAGVKFAEAFECGSILLNL